MWTELSRVMFKSAGSKSHCPKQATRSSLRVSKTFLSRSLSYKVETYMSQLNPSFIARKLGSECDLSKHGKAGGTLENLHVMAVEVDWIALENRTV